MRGPGKHRRFIRHLLIGAVDADGRIRIDRADQRICVDAGLFGAGLCTLRAGEREHARLIQLALRRFRHALYFMPQRAIALRGRVIISHRACAGHLLLEIETAGHGMPRVIEYGLHRRLDRLIPSFDRHGDLIDLILAGL